MMKKFITEKGLVTPTKYFGDDYILFSEKYEKEELTFVDKFKNQPSLRPEFFRVNYDEIIEINPLPNYDNPTIQMNIVPGGDYDLFYLDFKSKEEYKQALNFLLEKTNLKEIERKENNYKNWIKKFLYTVLVAIFGGVVHQAAVVYEQGGHMETSGRRSGIKKLIVSVGEYLGSTTSMILWILLVVLFSYFTYRSFKESRSKKSVYVISK